MSISEGEELFAIGGRLEEERLRLGYSQKSLATLTVKTSRTQIKYESGETMPDAAYLLKLARLGADVYYIITGERSANALTVEEQALLNGYRSLDERGKLGVHALIGGMTTPEETAAKAVFKGSVGQAVHGNINAPFTIDMGGTKKKNKKE
jgi:transcriptional regulator with XRE-family HTH domain